VPQHIGTAGIKATAWVEHSILSPSPQVKRTKELQRFVEGLRSLFDPGEPLDVATRRWMETFFGYSLKEVRIHRGQEAEEASRQMGARAFTFRGEVFGPHRSLDTSTKEGLGLLAHELTHAIQQTQPHQLPQGHPESSDVGLASAASLKSHSGAEMVLLAPASNSPITTNLQQREAQAQANERLVIEGLGNRTESPPQIDPELVAAKVYRLMQQELVLERERATKLGG
jgi:hypothetical protein